MELVLVFLLGLVSSFISNLTGGGGYFLLLPAMIHLGLEPLEAVGTIKLGAIGISVGSVFGAKNKSVIRKDHLKPLLIIAIISSIIGPLIAFSFSEDQVKIILSVIIIATALISMFSLRPREQVKPSRTKQRFGYAVYFIVNIMFAAFGGGIGMLVNYVMIGFLGLSAIESTATRRVIGAIILPLQAIFFIGQGHVNIALGMSLLAGTGIGGFIGLNFAISKGEVFVRRAMAFIAVVLVISLFV